jgi:thiol:disulfide interchange protein DsbD
MIGLVFLALSVWALGSAQAKRSIASVALFIIGFAAAIALITMPLEGRKSSLEPAGAADIAQPYTAARLADLRAQGKPVFVNLTAAWCVSCLYNERVALSSPKVREAFKSTDTAYVVGDWTNQNHEISALLRQHSRDGVPLYLYFPPNAGEPEVLPQILSESLLLATLGNKK